MKNVGQKLAVILCGGIGARLRPYTLTIPKPLMPIGSSPILEILIRQLKQNGFEKIILAVNYRAEMIRAYFGDGKQLGVSIEYCEEAEPLGTIGPLNLIPHLPEKFLLLNGDILTDLNFSDLLDRHQPHEALLTIPLSRREHCIDFGVFELNKNLGMQNFQEKPTLSFAVSMGVYGVSASILPLIPPQQLFGFDHLMKKILDEKQKVSCYYHAGFWLDIGRHEDYAKAQDDWLHLEKAILK